MKMVGLTASISLAFIVVAGLRYQQVNILT